MNKTYRLSDIATIAKEVIKRTTSKTLLFYGEMGAGKTTLIKELCKELGTEDVTSSPTFSLVNEYRTISGEIVYHFDFYRITREEEAYDIGFEDYLYSDVWCFIEWPENVKNLVPLNATEVYLKVIDNQQRNLQLTPSL